MGATLLALGALAFLAALAFGVRMATVGAHATDAAPTGGRRQRNIPINATFSGAANDDLTFLAAEAGIKFRIASMSLTTNAIGTVQIYSDTEDLLSARLALGTPWTLPEKPSRQGWGDGIAVNKLLKLKVTSGAGITVLGVICVEDIV